MIFALLKLKHVENLQSLAQPNPVTKVKHSECVLTSPCAPMQIFTLEFTAVTEEHTASSPSTAITFQMAYLVFLVFAQFFLFLVSHCAKI